MSERVIPFSEVKRTMLTGSKSRADLESENARLQARVEEEKGITDTAIRAMERAESDREGYKALAEQRGEALEEAQGKLDATKTAYMNHQWRKLGRILSKEENE